MPENTTVTLFRGRHVLIDAEDGIGRWIDDGAIAVAGATVRESGPFETLRRRFPDATIIGDGSQIVMPGLIDAHTHGYGITRVQAGVGYDFLENMLLDEPWRVSLPPDLGAALTAVRHLANGCTTLHHTGWDDLGPDAIGNAEKAIGAYRKTGIRLAYSPAIRNVNRFACDEKDFLETLPPDLRALARPFTEYDADEDEARFFEVFEHLHAKYNGPDVRILLGPSWAHGGTDRLMDRIRDRAAALGGVPIHIHTLQTPHQRAYGFKKYGRSLLAVLDDKGLVAPNTVFGHMVWISADDIALLARRGASITHHASCNLHVRNGIAPVYELLRAGVNVAMGIDDKSINDDEDPFMEMRLIHQLHRIPGFDLEGTPAITGAQVLRMATVNAAHVIGFGNRLGTLAAGHLADLVLVDAAPILDAPWTSPDADLLETVVLRAKGSHVRTVVVGGQVVVEDGRFVGYDVEALFAEVKALCARGLSNAQRARQEPIRRLIPFHQRWHNEMLAHLDVTEPFYRLNGR
ncbi:MAG: amidohydrolase family protein [Rhodospirillales bacterium]|nr:amidohydrolase family protein [Rhodospirillales bacterium]